MANNPFINNFLPVAPLGYLGVSASLRGIDSNTLTKAELAEILFEQMGLNKREAKEIVESFFDHVCLALEQGDHVKLSGFGNFQLREKPQRPGRNPKTGEVIPIAARRVVTFHASQKLKEQVDLGGLSGSEQLTTCDER